ncbi:MAG: hypothetical protein WCO96_09225 [Actinomycetes bacterium]
MSKPLQIGLACAIGGAFSVLVFNPAPIYDPAAWLVWAAELTHRKMALEAGPSWKPLPVIVSAPATLISWELAAIFWLWIVRASTILTSVMLWRLAASRGGAVAGAIAAICPFLIGDWVQLALGGGSEPVLMALALVAVKAHLAGRRWAAFGLGVAAGLLRPEAWAFLVLYGLWLLHRERGRAILPVTAGAVIQMIGWFVVPSAFGGDALQASRHARAYQDSVVPTGEFLERTFNVMPWQVWILAAVGLFFAFRERDRLMLLLAGGAALWVLEVGALTAFGYSGLGRYSLPAAVILGIHAGSGAGKLIRSAPAGAPRLATGAAILALSGTALLNGATAAGARFEKVQRIDAQAEQVRSLVARAGGIQKLVAICGRLGTNWTYSTTAAWRVRTTLGNVSARPIAPGIVIVRKGSRSETQPVPPLGTTGRKVLRSQGQWSIVLFTGNLPCQRPS